ncbi:cystathionine gamma-lyase [Ixodes scapularis]
MAAEQWHFNTKAVHVGQDPDQWNSRAVIPPITLSSTFQQKAPGESYPHGFEYSRSDNPSRKCLEEGIASLEHAKYALAFASGMAAINNVMNLVSPGDHILVWLESPSNPTMKLVDIKGACEIVRKRCCAILVVDNTFMSSYFQKPIDLGAHISVHSLTKYMNGHSDVVMGAVITNDKKIYDQLRFFQNAAGAVPSPFDCFLANRGLKTLPVRMERHMENGLKVAKFLASHPLVEKVIHPGLPSHPQHELAMRQSSGFSGMVSFYIKGGLTESTNFLKSTKIIALASSLGGVESLSELPTVMSHASVKEEVKKAIGITDNLIRLSIGIEHIDDLLNDICQALHKAVQCTAVCEENLEEMDDNAALANEFELPFIDLTPTEREKLLRTQNSGLALCEGAPGLPPTPRSPPPERLPAPLLPRLRLT